MAAFVALAFLFQLAVLVGMLVAGIVFLVAVWRTMRAHETTADAAREAVQDYLSKSGG
jgi:hypothetical protein